MIKAEAEQWAVIPDAHRGTDYEHKAMGESSTNYAQIMGLKRVLEKEHFLCGPNEGRVTLLAKAQSHTQRLLQKYCVF